ncbi:zinc knuckle-domain-containing protein [Podospora appendiculata]|uniref:Zinc knuckle-domain-containing protein n=1 Tax=Podospora appendiculata TaxID=314037 RepID=A0AAE0X4E7_9PEZI|nr:zinc knuckle-domain-containing protein [Podospora appendiculata]
MYGRGPPKAPPANVQCQKCLKRGHYSYECKAAPQERPYVPRPSRTQQLFNPKLLPKLANAVPDALQRKKGVADEELAKKEAERARKRDLEAEEEPTSKDSPSKRRRSLSYDDDSVSSLSTRSPSPPPRRTSRSPRQSRPRVRDSPDPSPRPRTDRHHSVDSNDERDYSSRSVSPENGYSGRPAAERRSPSPRRERAPARAPRDTLPDRDDRRDSQARRGYSRSRSPARSPARPPLGHDKARGYRARDDHSQPTEGRPQQQQRNPAPPPRERSLSPFSRRLALTQTMNR